MSMENSVKVKRLVHISKLPRPYVRGLLDQLWSAAHATGNPILGDADSVEIASEWPGDRGQWFELLRAERWIEETAPNTWRIHDYYDHCPDWVIKRIARARGCEYKGLRPILVSEYRNPVEKKRKPSESKPRKAKPSQGIESKGSPDPVCSEPTSPASEPSASVPVPILEFPTVGKPKRSWPLTQAKLAEWVEAYPGVDVMAECRKALQWCRDNPTKQKTFDGMLKFLSGWLGRCQDRGLTHGPAPPRETVAEKSARLLGLNT